MCMMKEIRIALCTPGYSSLLMRLDSYLGINLAELWHIYGETKKRKKKGKRNQSITLEPQTATPMGITLITPYIEVRGHQSTHIMTETVKIQENWYKSLEAGRSQQGGSPTQCEIMTNPVILQFRNRVSRTRKKLRPIT